MFVFPPQTAFGKTIPKTRIYAHAAPTRRVRELFVSQLSEIIWAHKLSPETLRLPATSAVPEIQIFDVHLKAAEIDDEVLQVIDRAIPYPVIHRIRSAKGVAWSAAFKRPSEADSTQWVVGTRFRTPVVPESTAETSPPLPTALDLSRLYAGLFAPLLPLPPRPGEDLSRHISRCEAYTRLSRSVDQLRARIARESHFNRKVELNRELKPLQAELETLSG